MLEHFTNVNINHQNRGLSNKLLATLFTILDQDRNLSCIWGTWNGTEGGIKGEMDGKIV